MTKVTSTTNSTNRRKDQRLEFRTTAEDRELFARAAELAGTDLTGFANEHLRIAALRILADRTAFELSEEQADAWDQINDRPARDLPALREFLTRPSIFVDG